MREILNFGNMDITQAQTEADKLFDKMWEIAKAKGDRKLMGKLRALELCVRAAFDAVDILKEPSDQNMFDRLYIRMEALNLEMQMAYQLREFPAGGFVTPPETPHKPS